MAPNPHLKWRNAKIWQMLMGDFAPMHFQSNSKEKSLILIKFKENALCSNSTKSNPIKFGTPPFSKAPCPSGGQFF